MKNCKPIQTSLVNQKLTKNMHEEKETDVIAMKNIPYKERWVA